MLPGCGADKNGSICLDEFASLISSDEVNSIIMDAPALFSKTQAVAKTNEWQSAVTEHNCPETVARIFSDDAVLLGTVSRTIRTQEGDGVLNIKEYFDYFAKLPGIQVVRREDNVVSVSDDVFVNNAMVYWAWEGEGTPTPEEPLCARMTFVYRQNPELQDVELFQLHSSALPASKID